MSLQPLHKGSFQGPAGLLILVVALGLTTAGAALIPGVLAVLALTLFGVLLLLFLVDRLTGVEPSTKIFVRRWTLANFALHLCVGIVVSAIPQGVAYFIPDSVGYHRDAVALTEHWLGDTPLPILPHGKEGFAYLLAGLYLPLGRHPTLGIVLNSIMAAALVPLISDVARRTFGGASTRSVPVILTCMPGLIFWPSLLLREAAILFLIAVVINCAARLAEGASLTRLVVLPISLTLLFTLRSPIALVLSFALLIALPFAGSSAIRGIVVGTSTLTVILVLVFGLGVGRSGLIYSLNESSLASASDMRKATPRTYARPVGEGSTFNDYADFSSVLGAMAYLPSGYLHVLFGPFPWTVTSSTQLPGIIDGFAWMAMLPSLLRGARRGRQLAGRRVLILVVPSLLISLVLVLAISNYGVAIRERTQVLLPLVPLIAVGIHARATGPQRRVPRVGRCSPLR